MIYLASPYSSGNLVEGKGKFTADEALEKAMQERYEDAEQVVAILTRQQIVVYSPIVHYHNLAKKYKLQKELKFWLRIDFHMIQLSSLLLVLQLEGWKYSKGVENEVREARRLDKNVRYILLEEALEIKGRIIQFRKEP